MEKVRIENVEHLQNLRNELSIYLKLRSKFAKLQTLSNDYLKETAEIECYDLDEVEILDLRGALLQIKVSVKLYLVLVISKIMGDFFMQMEENLLNFKDYIDMQLPPQIITSEELWYYLKQMSPKEQRIAFHKILIKMPFEADDYVEAIESDSPDIFIEFMKKNFSEQPKEITKTINEVKISSKFYLLSKAFESICNSDDEESLGEIISTLNDLVGIIGSPYIEEISKIMSEISSVSNSLKKGFEIELLDRYLELLLDLWITMGEKAMEEDETVIQFKYFLKERFEEEPLLEDILMDFLQIFSPQNEEPSQTPVLLENQTPAPALPRSKALPQAKAVNEDSDLIPKITSPLPFPTAIESEKWGNKQKKDFMWGIINYLIVEGFIAEDSEKSFWKYFYNSKSTNPTCDYKKIVWEKDRQDLQYLIISLYKEADRRKGKEERFNYWSDVQNIFKRSRKDKNGCLSFKELSNNSPLFKMIEDGKYKKQAIIDGIIEKAKKEANKK